MKIIKPSFKIITEINEELILKSIELYGRNAYKSENKITPKSSRSFVKMLINNGHETVLEHQIISTRIICDRGVSHELVRHRIASYTQESTRYCNYSKGRFENEISVIKPLFWSENTTNFEIWKGACEVAEKLYMSLIENGASPEEARSVLPTSLKTEIVVTMNLRQWRYFLRLRTAKDVHPQMREITIPLLNELKRRLPSIFYDIEIID